MTSNSNSNSSSITIININTNDIETARRLAGHERAGFASAKPCLNSEGTKGPFGKGPFGKGPKTARCKT